MPKVQKMIEMQTQVTIMRVYEASKAPSSLRSSGLTWAEARPEGCGVRNDDIMEPTMILRNHELVLAVYVVQLVNVLGHCARGILRCISCIIMFGFPPPFAVPIRCWLVVAQPLFSLSTSAIGDPGPLSGVLNRHAMAFAAHSFLVHATATTDRG